MKTAVSKPASNDTSAALISRSKRTVQLHQHPISTASHDVYEDGNFQSDHAQVDALNHFQPQTGHDFSTIAVLNSDSQQERWPSLSSFPSTLGIQPKLKVNTPGDEYEQEADRVAEQVIHMPEPQVQRQPKAHVSSISSFQAECSTRDLGAGHPLDEKNRQFFEARFGYDLSNVRIHADAASHAAAMNLNARAFTAGNHIAFDRSHSPGHDTESRRLLAHELTHVVQQGGQRGQADMVQRDFSLAWLKEKKEQIVQRAKQELNDVETKVTSGVIAAEEKAQQAADKVRATVAIVEAEIRALPDKATAAVKTTVAEVKAEVKQKVTQISRTVDQAKNTVAAKATTVATAAKSATATAAKEVKKFGADKVMEQVGTLKGVLLEGANIIDTLLWLRGLTDEWSEKGIRKAYQFAKQKGTPIPFSEEQIVAAFKEFSGYSTFAARLEKYGLAKRDKETGQLSTAMALSESVDKHADALGNTLGSSNDQFFTPYERGELVGAVGSQIALSFVGVEEVQLALKGLNALSSIKSLVSQCKPGWESSPAFWITLVNTLLGVIGLKSGAAANKVVKLLTQGGALAGLVPPIQQLIADYNDTELAKNEEQRRKRLSKDWDAIARGFAMIAFSIVHGRLQEKGAKGSTNKEDAPTRTQGSESEPISQSAATPTSEQPSASPSNPKPTKTATTAAHGDPAEAPQNVIDIFTKKPLTAKEIADRVANKPPTSEPESAPIPKPVELKHTGTDGPIETGPGNRPALAIVASKESRSKPTQLPSVTSAPATNNFPKTMNTTGKDPTSGQKVSGSSDTRSSTSGTSKANVVPNPNPTLTMIRSGNPKVIHYPIEHAQAPPLPGTRQTGIDRAWRQEVDLIRKTGRGTAPWTADEIAQINSGATYKDLGYTGHHINKVSDFPAWQGDPRNIAFLKQGSGESHMKLGHPGGTKVPQVGGDLIDRVAMLESE